MTSEIAKAKYFKKNNYTYIKDGELVVVTSRNLSSLKKGDHVLCYYQGKLQQRIILEICQDNYLPRYRIASDPPKWIGKEKVVARYMFIDKQVIEAVANMEDKHVLIMAEPEILDFNSKKTVPKLVIIDASGTKVQIPLSPEEERFTKMLRTLGYYIGKAGTVVLGWNIKNIFSYFRFRLGKDYIFEAKVFDLKVAEAYFGIEGKRPKSYIEAFERLKKLREFQEWDKFSEIYRKVHLPLIKEILPDLETFNLVDRSQNKKVYPFYEVEGQINGRLRCSKEKLNSYNPHNLSEEEKKNLTGPGYPENELFVYFDYNHMEVSVLTWLSGDKNLSQILESGDDLYEAIWKKLTQIDCTPQYRKICKSVFLPVVYGQGVLGIAKSINCSEGTAQELTQRIHSEFRDAMLWIVEQQNKMVNKTAVDHFGRRRIFEEREYRARNFAIQAPASIICLDKLIKLTKNLGNLGRVVFHVHDGYALITDKKDMPFLCQRGKEILESEEDFYPGLKLKISTAVGDSLNTLQPFKN